MVLYCVRLHSTAIGVVPKVKSKGVDEYISRLNLVRAIGLKGANLTELIEGMLLHRLSLLPNMYQLKGSKESSLLTTCKGLFELLRLTSTEYAGEVHEMAVYIMENAYSIQSPDEFVHCTDLINLLRTYPLAIEIQSVTDNEVQVYSVRLP